MLSSFFIFFIFITSNILCSNSYWTWISGYKDERKRAIHGELGEFSPDFTPGRTNLFSIFNFPKRQSIVMFGGWGWDENVNTGWFGDIWEFNTTTLEWGLIYQIDISSNGNYISYRNPQIGDHPGARYFCYGDKNVVGDSFYVFGGRGYSNGFGNLNDMWSYDMSTSLWTWEFGNNNPDIYTTYGTINQYSTGTVIGARYGGVMFNFGLRFFIFGGFGRTDDDYDVLLNDMYEFDRSRSSGDDVRWIGGSKDPNVYPSYPLSVEYVNSYNDTFYPGGRKSFCGWKVSANEFMIYGGLGMMFSMGGEGVLDHLWGYNIDLKMWKFVMGSDDSQTPSTFSSKGTYDDDNYPGGLHSHSCACYDSDHFILHSGQSDLNIHKKNHLLIYKLSTNRWMWEAGSLDYQYGEFGGALAQPGSRTQPGIAVTNSDQLFIFSGHGMGEFQEDYLNDLFLYKFSTKKYQFVAGYENSDELGVFEDKSFRKAHPGRRNTASFCKVSESLFLIGYGYGYSSSLTIGYLSDLWLYDVDSNEFTFIAGSDERNQPSIFGESYEYNNAFQIGGRSSSVCGRVNNNQYAFFGGSGVADVGTSSLNSLFIFNLSTRAFAHYSGVDQEVPGIFGLYQVPSPTSYPGSRTAHTGHVIDNKFYIFGGSGLTSLSDIVRMLNDVWEYDFSSLQWRWVHGSSTVEVQGALYNDTGVYFKSNMPGVRRYHQSWRYDNTFIIFGGYGSDINGVVSYNSDTWQFNIDILQWRFIGGREKHVYGCRETGSEFHDLNYPGSRMLGTGVSISGDINLYLFGGRGRPCGDHKHGSLNDLWVFNMTTWQWMATKRIEEVNVQGYYGEQGVGDVSNYIGSRESSVVMASRGSIYVMFGYGYDSVGASAIRLSDVFVIRRDYGCFGYVSSNKLTCSGHGDCINDDTCSCGQFYHGENCEINICHGLFSNNSHRVCSGHGKCSDYYKCDCKENYKGDQCELTSCWGVESDTSNACSLGQCIAFDKCRCDEVFFTGKGCNNISTFFFVVVSVPIVLFVVLFVVLLAACIVMCNKKKIQKGIRTFKAAQKLENIELLLEEQEIEKDVSVAHLAINKKLFEIKYEDLKVMNSIGKGGGSGIIYKCIWRGSQTVAFKCFKIHDFLSQDRFNEFEKEAAILSSVSHPHILIFYGCCLSPPRIGIVTDFCENGDIKTYVQSYKEKNKESISFDEKVRFAKEIASGLDYLHSKSIIHRDVKCENCLVDNSKSIRIMDFGISKMLEDATKTLTKRIGTTYYIAPEVTLGEKYNEKCDVFSYSMLLHELFSEEFNPFSSTTYSVEFKIAKDPNFRPKMEKGKKFPKNWLLSLIRKCWLHNSAQRPSFNEIFKIIETSHKKEEKEYEISVNVGNDVTMLDVAGLTVFDVYEGIKVKWKERKVKKVYVDVGGGKEELKDDEQMSVEVGKMKFYVEFEKTSEEYEEIVKEMAEKLKKYEEKFGKI